MSVRVGDFWSGATAAPLVVLSDFDYTISQVDVGDLIVQSLCPPSEETLRRDAAGEIGSREWYLDTMARADMAEALALADTVEVDPHFPPFVQWCKEQGIPLAVVSDGFGYYIEHILRKNGLGGLPVFCNEMPERGLLEFPHGNPVCERCACCKAGVSRRVRESGARVIYVGDGTSDVYASAFADWVFAKGHLAWYLERQGTPFYRFADFADVAGVLSANLDSFRDGSAPNRCTLAPSPHCKF